MKIDQLKALAAGTILYIAQDNKRYAGHAGRFAKISPNNNAGLMVKGAIVWINPERLEIENGK
jgi:hypothetical protein